MRLNEIRVVEYEIWNVEHGTMQYERELVWPIFQKELVQVFPGFRILLAL